MNDKSASFIDDFAILAILEAANFDYEIALDYFKRSMIVTHRL